MKRRIIALLLALIMILGISTACGKKNSNDKSDSQTSKTPVESNAVQNGEDTRDGQGQVRLEASKEMERF